MNKHISKIASIYSKALIETAKQGKISFTDIIKDLNTTMQILNTSPELFGVLNSPAVSYDQKMNIIEDIFKSQVSTEILNYLKVIAEKNRFKELDAIKFAFKKEVDEINGRKSVLIISSTELSEEYKSKIITKLKDKLNKVIDAEWQIDRSIIGGLVIKIDDNVVDTSVKNKLTNLSKQIIKGNI